MKNYVSSLLRKLGFERRTAAAVYASAKKKTTPERRPHQPSLVMVWHSPRRDQAIARLGEVDLLVISTIGHRNARTPRVSVDTRGVSFDESRGNDAPSSWIRLRHAEKPGRNQLHRFAATLPNIVRRFRCQARGFGHSLPAYDYTPFLTSGSESRDCSFPNLDRFFCRSMFWPGRTVEPPLRHMERWLNLRPRAVRTPEVAWIRVGKPARAVQLEAFGSGCGTQIPGHRRGD